MNDERKLFKWAMVVVPCAVAALAIYPPHRKLKAGIDLAGGSSLLFEIDTSGLESREVTGLADRVMQVLKQRVDPNGQLNLIWRPIGNNRLEIQMPRPPREALERRKAYEAARAELAKLNVSRRDLESMLNAPPEQRQAARDRLASGIATRGTLLDTLIDAYDKYQQARAGDDLSAEDQSRTAYEEAFEDVLETSINLGRLGDVLALGNRSERDAELAKIRAEHASPQYAAALDEVIAKYDVWAKDKGMLEDPSDLKRRIRGAGVLEFRILAERDPSSPTMTAHTQPYLQEPVAKYVEQLHKRGPRARPGDHYQWFEVADIVDFLNSDSIANVESGKDTSRIFYEKYAGKWYALALAERKFGLLRDSAQKWKLVSAFVGVDGNSGGPAVDFQLDARGGRQFATLTSENIDRPMAIMLDNVCQTFANIASTIRERGQITSSRFTQTKVNDMVAVLRAGSLPARLIETPLMEQTIGPQLGEQNRRLGMRAVIIGAIAVVVFMVIYYRFAGFIADVALLMNLLFVLGIMAAMQATFTLPGIAGLILTVGMAVDANVLIFERIREERDRGVGMRKALRIGYERALSTIVDANLTTLITCVILGYLGTEEVKGFAMVLGFGIASSMFTSLFVTRLILESLLAKGVIKSLHMMRLLRRPQIDWLALRRLFWPVSGVLVAAALAFTTILSQTDREALYDIEFLGGTSVQFELKKGEKLDDAQARQLVAATGPGVHSAAQWLRDTAAPAIAKATVTKGSGTSFNITSDTLTAAQMEALLRSRLESSVDRGGFRRAGHTLTIDAKTDADVTVESLKATLPLAAQDTEKASQRLASARIQTVEAIDAQEDAPPAFEVITVETNKNLVQSAILAAMGTRLNVQRAISFKVAADPDLAPEGYRPIEEDVRYLEDVIEHPNAHYDIQQYKGGAAIVVEGLDPPVSVPAFEQRIREIRLQPDFAKFDTSTRPFHAFGLDRAGSDGGEPVYSSIAYVVVDENILFYDDPGDWEEVLAKPELALITEALSTEKSLRKVLQFAPQVAGQTQQQALIAIVMAMAAIVAYIWIRFGQMQFGLAAIVALVHDVVITLGLVAGAHFVYKTAIGQALGLTDFKIDLPMIAAFLTIIGYSLNDTIVVFDRIRENRGKIKGLNPGVINSSINQCLSRTVLTSLTTFLTVAVMYAIGGLGIHGFSFALLAGVVVGTYSSVGIATPLLYKPRVLHVIVYVLVALGIYGGFTVMVGDAARRELLLIIAGVVILALLAWAVAVEMRTTRRAPVIAGGRT